MFEMLVGLEVSDNEIYAQYRAAMKPILARYEGGFGYDFVVSEVLLSEVDTPINRVFTIRFPTPSSADDFFGNEEYQAVKEQFFVKSVSHITIIARYHKEAA